MYEVHITKGNKKLPSSILNFSLPPIETCPQSTEKCRKICYALKAWNQYPNVRKAWTENYKLSLTSKFVELVSAKIYSVRKCEVFRISVSGDFYSQIYLNKWFDISKLFPDIVFYSYTKSTHLDFSLRPKKFIILLSDDDGNLKQQWKDFDGTTKVVKVPKKERGWFICPMNCRNCNYCYTITRKKKRLIFPEH